MDQYEEWIGKTVRKKSNKPFKSGLKVATVKGYLEHPFLEGVIALSFEEDDSFVRASICREVLE